MTNAGTRYPRYLPLPGAALETFVRCRCLKGDSTAPEGMQSWKDVLATGKERKDDSSQILGDSWSGGRRFVTLTVGLMNFIGNDSWRASQTTDTGQPVDVARVLDDLSAPRRVSLVAFRHQGSQVTEYESVEGLEKHQVVLAARCRASSPHPRKSASSESEFILKRTVAAPII